MAGASESSSENDSYNAPSDEDKAHLILQFQEIVGIENERESRLKLESHNWNLEAAIQTSFNESEGLPSVYDNKYRSADESSKAITKRSTSHKNAIHITRRNTWSQWIKNVFFIPITIFQISFQFGYSLFSEFFNFVLSIISPSHRQTLQGPIDDVLNFKKEFESVYGMQHPTFYQGSYQQALNDAKKELKFLLIYLHAADHQDTPEFCRDVLSNNGFVEYVNGSMIFWACDVSSNEGHRVSRAVRETTYPFLGLVCLRDYRMVIVWKCEGSMNVDQIMAELVQVIDENEPSLVAARAERNELSMSQNIRNEQDAAYQDSLAKDKKKAEERQKLLDAEKKIEYERQQKRIKKEKKIQAIKENREKCCQALKNCIEPAPGDEGAIMIRVKLPNGRQLQRYFLKTTTLQFLYSYVLANDVTLSDFVLSTNFPRKSFELQGNELKTLQDLGIVTSSPMFVHNVADDSSDDE
ncbi:FAS-associated factor 2 [Hydra vulgaris]|nr:FAS-associated factor 2 [Hydra vulgaris]